MTIDFKIFSRQSFSWLAGVLLTLGVCAAHAATYKLYINKTQSADNVIAFENGLSATVKHTSEGMELEIPGVEVNLRCKPGSCIMAWNESTGSVDDSNEQPATCVEGTWATTCDDPPADDPPADDPPPSGGSGDCVNTAVIVCTGLDYGSDGANLGGNSSQIRLDSGKVAVFTMTMKAGGYMGNIGMVPDSSSQPTTGALRTWVSKEPNGAPVSTSGFCTYVSGLERTLNWDQSGNRGYGCLLEDAATTYFYNVTYCDAPSTDKTCSSSGAVGAGNIGFFIGGVLANS